MENSADWEQKTLINELTQGRELAKQLQTYLNPTSSSHETRELLVHKIINSYDKALSMLKWNAPVALGEPQLTGAAIGIMSESPRSLSGSPHSEDSDRDFKDHEHRDGSRKRKSMPRWTQQVQVCPGTGLEAPLDDGYSWRKYGQKDILGAKYPRGYYRCTHRNVHGCLATKQVQRSDDDPTIFEINYRGRHTCTPAAAQPPPPPPPPPEKQEPNTTLDNPPPPLPPQQNQQQQSLETLLNFRTGLKIITEDLDIPNNQTAPLFYFPSTSQENYNVHIHSPMANFSDPSFISPATSGTSYFSVSPQTGTGMASFGGNQSLEGSDQSELGKIVSAATNSPTAGLDFPFGSMDQFEPSFSFDNNPGFNN